MVYIGRFTSMLKSNQEVYLLFDLWSVDNTLKYVTVVNCAPFLHWKYGSPIELINK